MLNHLSLYCIL